MDDANDTQEIARPFGDGSPEIAESVEICSNHSVTRKLAQAVPVGPHQGTLSDELEEVQAKLGYAACPVSPHTAVKANLSPAA